MPRFEVGDLVWYRNFGHADPPAPAIITSRRVQECVTFTCRREGINFDSWGDIYQFSSRACHLCGAAVDAPGYPLCPGCIEAEAEEGRDTRAETEQRRRPR